MKLSDLESSSYWPTLLNASLCFGFAFMVWTAFGPLGEVIGEALHLNAAQMALMLATPILSGAFLRIMLGVRVDRIEGVRSLCIFYSIAALCPIAAAVTHPLWVCVALFAIASGSLGMAIGSVFQNLPLRFGKDLDVLTDLVRCGGGVGQFAGFPDFCRAVRVGHGRSEHGQNPLAHDVVRGRFFTLEHSPGKPRGGGAPRSWSRRRATSHTF